jgi:hypothetical protein
MLTRKVVGGATAHSAGKIKAYGFRLATILSREEGYVDQFSCFCFQCSVSYLVISRSYKPNLETDTAGGISRIWPPFLLAISKNMNQKWGLPTRPLLNYRHLSV